MWWQLMVAGIIVALLPIALMMIACIICDIADFLEPHVERLLSGEELHQAINICLWIGGLTFIVSLIISAMENAHVS